MDWQPIETAPLGTPILAWNATRGMHECFIPHSMQGWSRITAVTHKNRKHGIVFAPTHWMPLPQPPSAAE